ncbi:nectin-1 [Acanthochromis polyacanthus]|uniref:nectin-1 n=1 Tax=Acanthochromis polyacanthus TaxID=80966 RepID=UPI000B902A51|nr:nectin-1 [Acanthochromis polyacanthus]
MSTFRGNIRTLVGLFIMVQMVSGDDIIYGFVGEDVLLPCTCLNRDSAEEFRWQTEGKKPKVVVKHTWETSNFTDGYTGRAQLFLSENSNDCSLLLNNISRDDEREYKCSFKHGGGLHHYSKVNLTVFERNTGPVDGLIAPTELPSPNSIRIFMPIALVVVVLAVAVLSLFLLHKRRVSGWLNAGQEETLKNDNVKPLCV